MELVQYKEYLVNTVHTHGLVLLQHRAAYVPFFTQLFMGW